MSHLWIRKKADHYWTVIKHIKFFLEIISYTNYTCDRKYAIHRVINCPLKCVCEYYNPVLREHHTTNNSSSVLNHHLPLKISVRLLCHLILFLQQNKPLYLL